MSTSIESAESESTDDAPRSRRHLLRGGAIAAAGAAGAAVVAAAGSTPASAAINDPVRLGRENWAAAGSTLIASESNPPTLVVNNDGYGAGALVTGRLGNGIAAGTHREGSVGLSAANYSTRQGTGSAVAAGGGVNTGVSATSQGVGKFAVSAYHNGRSGPFTEGGALAAYSTNKSAIVATTDNVAAPAIVANSPGSDEPTPALQANGLVRIEGPLYVSGDLVVEGTIYCDDVQPLSAAMRRQVRADSAAAAESARVQARAAQGRPQGD